MKEDREATGEDTITPSPPYDFVPRSSGPTPIPNRPYGLSASTAQPPPASDPPVRQAPPPPRPRGSQMSATEQPPPRQSPVKAEKLEEPTPVEPTLSEDQMRVLNALLSQPGRELYTQVLSPTFEPGTTW
ncbi:LOW QUALITY PROTEIN: hypothetical protein N665_0398s0003 [Sinapis alba]|nr:LOW QUALITY PROTEIN: hypothetical protein N665_0398s0003 [Sinapis alba]